MENYYWELRKLIGTRPINVISAGVVLYKDDQVLLQRRADDGTWGLHGGGSELGEAMEDAAKRELFEETGLVAEELELFGVYSGRQMHYIYPDGNEVYYTCVIYTCKKFSGSFILQEEEVSELQWFSMRELPENMSILDGPIIKEFAQKCGCK